jgi:Xaa-Pro aminopeptidase
MPDTRQNLLLAELKAKELCKLAEDRQLIVPGKTEWQLSNEIVQLAKDEFATDVHWGKKNVRTGINTLQPYMADPPDLVIQEGDILFFDFHPVFDGWEADIGHTYVLGNDLLKHKIKKDVEAAWYEANAWYFQQDSLIGAEYFKLCQRPCKEVWV